MLTSEIIYIRIVHFSGCKAKYNKVMIQNKQTYPICKLLFSSAVSRYILWLFRAPLHACILCGIYYVYLHGNFLFEIESQNNVVGLFLSQA